MEPRSQRPVRVYIRDHLAADQISENVRILIDMREAGRLTLDQENTASVIPVDLSAPGSHSYVLEVKSVFRKERGHPEQREYVGRGTFTARTDKVFRLAADRTGNGMEVRLEADEDEQEIDE